MQKKYAKNKQKNTHKNTHKNTQNTQKIRSFPVLSVFRQEYAEYEKKYAKNAKSGNKKKYAEYALPTLLMSRY
jgi:hypothetical protein